MRKLPKEIYMIKKKELENMFNEMNDMIMKVTEDVKKNSTAILELHNPEAEIENRFRVFEIKVQSDINSINEAEFTEFDNRLRVLEDKSQSEINLTNETVIVNRILVLENKVNELSITPVPVAKNNAEYNINQNNNLNNNNDDNRIRNLEDRMKELDDEIN